MVAIKRVSALIIPGIEVAPTGADTPIVLCPPGPVLR